MNRQEAKDYINTQEPTFLTPARKRGYVCPVCANGTGGDGTGITKAPTSNRWHCFKCGLHADIFDLYGKHSGLSDDRAIFDGCYSYYGITPSGDGYKKQQKATVTPQITETEPDYSAFFAEAEAAHNYEYLKSRGISEEIQRYFHVGYVERWKADNAPDYVTPTPRCIIPTSRHSYIARDTRPNLTDAENKYSKMKGGKVHIFNLEQLTDPESAVVFVVEGEIDAMSIFEAGGLAVGLGSVSNQRLFLKYATENRAQIIGKTLVLMLDNDEPGQAGQKQLAESLTGGGIAFVEATRDGWKGHKDANEYLQADPDGLAGWVSSLQAEALKVDRPADVAPRAGESWNAGGLLEYFRNGEVLDTGFECKTGFSGLDDESRNLYGGLHDGLYIIGAISSLGKTTFCLQLAAQIAATGQDVLFFSLEQSKEELIAKCISRHTYDLYRNAKTKSGHFVARETAQLLNKRRYRFYDRDEMQAITDGIEAFEVEAEHLYIHEGRLNGERLTVEHIAQITREHINLYGTTPVVFIDYLQMIEAPEAIRGRASDKQVVDSAVWELKDLSRKWCLPVFAISSFNRENYYSPVTMASFKESGAIEYTSDVLFGLQYSGLNVEGIEDLTDAKLKKRFKAIQADAESKQAKKEPVGVELKCLKNRNGNKFTLQLMFVAAFNHYEEIAFNAEDYAAPRRTI